MQTEDFVCGIRSADSELRMHGIAYDSRTANAADLLLIVHGFFTRILHNTVAILYAARDGKERLDPRCSTQTYHRANQPYWAFTRKLICRAAKDRRLSWLAHSTASDWWCASNSNLKVTSATLYQYHWTNRTQKHFVPVTE